MAPQARERSGMGRCFALGQHCNDDVVLADPEHSGLRRCFALGQHCNDDVVLADPALSRSPVLAQLV
jgi:hypothetical protein